MEQDTLKDDGDQGAIWSNAVENKIKNSRIYNVLVDRDIKKNFFEIKSGQCTLEGVGFKKVANMNGLKEKNGSVIWIDQANSSSIKNMMIL